jgi:hypothetical protein
MKNKTSSFPNLKYRSLILTIIIFSLFLPGITLAQGDWTAILNLNPYPSPYLSEWQTNPNIGQADIINNSSEMVQVRVYLTLTRIGAGIIGKANSNLFDFPSGSTKNILVNDLVDYGSIEYDHSIEDIAVRTGRIPEGEYTACIRLENASGQILLDNICVTFYIIYPDPPMLVYPDNGGSIPTNLPFLQWTPALVPPQFPIHYYLKIAEVLEGQTPDEALNSNRPQYENFNITGSGISYPISALPFRNFSSYVWQVQVLDSYGYPPATNNGKSEIWTFRYEPDTTTPIIPRIISGNITDSATGAKLTGAEITYREVKRIISDNDTSWVDEKDSLYMLSDASGRFRFENVRDRSHFRLTINKPDYLERIIFSDDRQYEGKIENLNVKMTPAPLGNKRLAGVLKDILSNQPVANAAVKYCVMEYKQTEQGAIWVDNPKKTLTTLTDSEGRFVFTQAADSANFSISANYPPGYLPIRETGVQVGDIDNYVLFITPNSCNIAGTLQAWKFGKSNPPGRTQIYLKRITELGKISFNFVGATITVPSRDSLREEILMSAYSDEEGRFLLKDVRPSSSNEILFSYSYYGVNISARQKILGFYYKLIVDDPRFERYVSDSISFSPGVTIETGEHILTYTTGSISGIVSSAGKPVSDATVYLYQAARKPKADSSATDSTANQNWAAPVSSKPEGSPLDFYQTDSVGGFAFKGVPLNEVAQETDYYILWVESGKYTPATKNVRIAKKGEDAKANFTLTAQMGVIHGIVANEQSAGISGARVELFKKIDYTDIHDIINYIYRHISKPEQTASRDLNGDGNINLLDVALLIRNKFNRCITDPSGTYFGPSQYVETDGGGNYTLANIDSSYYIIDVTKAAFQAYRTEVFPVNLGDDIERDITLYAKMGAVEFTVKDARDTTRGLENVTITSSDIPSLSGNAYTDKNGKYFLAQAVADTIAFSLKALGLSDTDTSIVIKEDDTLHVQILMKRRTGTLLVVVKDKETDAVLPNFDVKFGKENTLTTDFNGRAEYREAPAGTDTLTVSPPDSPTFTKDYIVYKSPVSVVEGYNPGAIEVKLVPAARMSGSVKSKEDGKAIENVTIVIDGNDKVKAKSDASGNFVLRNVPADGAITLIARKGGYKTARINKDQPKAGDHIKDILINLEKSPLDSIFGFPVVVDSITESGANKKVWGAFNNVPASFGLKLKNSDALLYFNGIEVNSEYKPTSDTIYLKTTEAEVSVFGIDGKISYDQGLMLEWIDSLKAGRITGDVTLNDVLSSIIPNTKWGSFKIPKSRAPSFWSGGINRGLSQYGLTATGSEVQLQLKSVKVGIDYNKTNIDSTGFHFYGSLALGSKIKLEFENFHIGKNSDGQITLKSITIKTDPPIKIPFGVFTVIDSSTTWGTTGFIAKGAVVLDKLDKKEFGFENLHISPEGEFLSLKLTADEKNGTINVHGQKFQIQSLEFGTSNWESDTLPHVKYFAFSGKLTITKLEKPIEFQNLKYTENGEFTGKIGFNQSIGFAKVLTVMLRDIEFGIDKSKTEGRFVGISGGLKFGAINGLSIQASNFRVYYDGAVSIDEIAMDFIAGPAHVAIRVAWANNVFEGAGLLEVKPVFSAGAEFRYGGSTDWWIKITSGTRIPCGVVEIVKVYGGIGRKDDTWKFAFGGSIAPARADKGIALDINVEVQKTPRGVIILGDANVVVASKLAVGKATFELNFPENRLTGSIIFGYDLEALKASAQLDMGVKFGEYWYINGKAEISFLEFFKANGVIVVANNWPWTHDGKTEIMSGMYVALVSGFNVDANWYIIKWGFSYNNNASLLIKWNGDFAGKIAISGSAYAWIGLDLGIFTIDLIEARGSIALAGEVSKTGPEWVFDASAAIKAEATIGHCPNARCWSICTTCYIRIFGTCVFALPTGAKACVTLNAKFKYSTSGGIDVDVSI